MNELIKTGKRRTVLISISILLVSIHTIYFYHVVRPEFETKKLIQQIIRFLLTAGLLIAVYKGKKWAKYVSLVLFSLAAIGALVSVLTIETDSSIAKMPLLVMALIYSIALYHLGFSKSYKALVEFQNGNRDNLESEE